jgi:negative regulator of flagellin synthesis FlgM
MKIDQTVTLLKTAVARPALAAIKSSTVSQEAAATLTAAADQTRLASSTSLLPSTNGDFDAVRVAEIRENISAGRYQINPAKIADGLLSTVRDLLGKNQP